MSSNIATAFRPRSAYVTAARRSNRAATAVAVFRSIHNQLSIASTSVAEPCAPLRLRNIIESSFSSAQLAASTVKIGNRAPAVRAVEVRAVASNTAQVKNRIDLMSENSPKRADCKEARMANEQGRRGPLLDLPNLQALKIRHGTTHKVPNLPVGRGCGPLLQAKSVASSLRLRCLL